MKVLKSYFLVLFMCAISYTMAQKTSQYTHLVLDVQGKIKLKNSKNIVLLKKNDSILLNKDSKLDVASKDVDIAYVRLWNLEKSEYERDAESLSKVTVHTATKVLKFADLNSRGFASASTIFIHNGKILNPKEINVRDQDLKYFVEFYQNGELLGTKSFNLKDRLLRVDKAVLHRKLDLSNSNNYLSLGYYGEKGQKKYMDIEYTFKEMKEVLSEIENVKKNLPNSEDKEYMVREYIDTFYGPYVEFKSLVNKLKK